MLGTLVNVGAVVVGSAVGLLVRARLPERLTKTAFQGIGLFTIAIGVSMAIKTANWLVVVFSIVPGAITGELIDIERRMMRLGEWLRRKLTPDSDAGHFGLCPKPEPGRFAEGMVAAFLLFCMGSMTVLGAIEEGTGRAPNLLLAKSALDGFAAIALAATFGIGVAFSVIPLLVYQGGLTLLASAVGKVLSETIVNEVSAVGGLLLIGLGVTLLEIKKVKVLNMLPALVIAGLLAWLIGT